MSLFDFINRSKDESGAKKEEYDLGEVTDEEAKVIREHTGHDVTGFRKTLSNHAVRHTHKKHGSKATEEPRGQLEMTPERIERAIEKLSTPSNAEDVSRGNTIRIKTIAGDEEGINATIQEIGEKKKKISPVTFWKRGK